MADCRIQTSSTARSVGVITDGEGRHFVREQLTIGVVEHVFGLGERFGALIKNDQSVDIWNADGHRFGAGVQECAPLSHGCGLWLSTSFTTNYDEQTVTSFIDGAPGRVCCRGEQLCGPRWHRERYSSDSLPLSVRPGSVLPIGARDDPPDYDHGDGVTLRAFEFSDGDERIIRVGEVTFTVRRIGAVVTAEADGARKTWQLQVGEEIVDTTGDSVSITVS